MKATIKKIVVLGIMFFTVTQLMSQKNVSRIPLLGEQAPEFTAETTQGTLDFPVDFGFKWKILFSHPGDFTPVCTSELMELALTQQEFKNLGVEVAVISTDNLEKHKLWVQSMEEMLTVDNHPLKINFPLIDDSKLNVGWAYGMLTADQSSFRAVRGVFIIDPRNKVRSVLFYPSEVGRNLDEIKRTVIALQTADKNTVLTPVNWKPGDDVLLPYPTSFSYYDKDSEQTPGNYNLSWYMLYKKLEK
jgi:peroxiredoxin 2/4